MSSIKRKKPESDFKTRLPFYKKGESRVDSISQRIKKPLTFGKSKKRWRVDDEGGERGAILFS